MRAIDRVHSAMCCGKPDRSPLALFVGCHAGSLIGKIARDHFPSEVLMLEGLQAAINRYGIPVGFDLQIEAEALGYQLVWADENSFLVSGHIC